MTEQQIPAKSSGQLRRAVVLTGCLAAIALLASVYWVSKLRLPDPTQADREGLVRWMALRDLNNESEDIQAALLARLEEEVQSGFETDALRSQIDERYRQRIWSNALVLVEMWYFNHVDEYTATEPAQRTAMLDRTIAEIDQWRCLAAIQPSPEPSETETTNPDAALLGILGRQVAAWKGDASEQRRKEITEFDTALRARWIMHALGLAPTAGT